MVYVITKCFRGSTARKINQCVKTDFKTIEIAKKNYSPEKWLKSHCLVFRLRKNYSPRAVDICRYPISDLIRLNQVDLIMAIEIRNFPKGEV